MASVGTIKYKNGSSWIDILHPVNSFYISYASTSPANLFGGTWTQITNAALRGASTVGYTGADTHTLTVDEMPSHRHALPQTYDVGSGAGATVPAWNSFHINTQYTDFRGGGAGTFNRATLLQLLYLVSHCISPRG